MARPKKQGIDYFPFDVDFFSDVKIRKIIRACGSQSTSILICLLCNIYKDNGYYILWDEDLPFVIADTVGVSEGAVKEVIFKAIQVGFFDKDIYDKYKVLTSHGIQNRFRSAVYKREEIEYVIEYLVSDVKNSISDIQNPVTDTGSTQSKVKVKRNKIKENSTCVEQKKKKADKDAAKAATLTRKDSFYKSLIPFVGKYQKEMIRAFYDYWSEFDASGTRMRFELERTWELEIRLAKWSNNEVIYNKGRSKQSFQLCVPLSDRIQETNERLALRDEWARKAVTYEEYKKMKSHDSNLLDANTEKQT